ncbi:TonB-dependent receptor [Luteimonas sp. SX5]|uniref:TonB-dependent receptor n=1 Tax=Luteimonas galliterrae TaxID=2940486 RepID=A0ABT0MGD7_9GAMM|nr:TonB-dependent receptor [Luteimonas galliterrae]MCL1633944.1 TonB-dependent receptor [Luteimonas galliterrae]
MKNMALKRTAICIAMGACLATLSPLALAQNATGAVAGRADAGAQVTVTNTATGLSRSVTANADGSYRLSQLPVGEYRVQVSRDGQAVGSPISANVALGGTTTVNLGGIGDLDTVTVVGSRVINRVDVRSTESSTNLDRQELARLPVDQNLTSVALLAPGVVNSGATFGGLTFGGSSVAENAVYINGLNVTDPYLRRGFSSVPFGFFEQFQIKTGGYSAEFGRTTGGVINAVTRSGSNEFHGGVELTFEPSAWSEQKDDHFHSDGSDDERGLTSRDDSSLFKTNVWASGPIVKDRLFFFGMYERRDADSRDIDREEAFYTNSPNDFWGAKFDWQITDDHLLELLAFSDEAESTISNYDYTWDASALGDYNGDSTSGSGGDNWSLTYTGHFTDNFVAKAMYGVNKRSAFSGSPRDVDCSIVSLGGTYTSLYGDPGPEGCHPTNVSISDRADRREAARLDFEWTLGDHLLRFGADQEVMDSNSSTLYPGDGVSYTAQAITNDDNDPNIPGEVNGVVLPYGTTYVDARRYITGAPVSTKAQAFYIEDNWNVTPNLLLNLGVRADKFENTLASGATFAKADFSDMISPRIGFSWDMKGDGTTKLFGNAGRYYLPLTNKLTDYFGGGTTDEHAYYMLNGWTEQIDPVTGGTYLLPNIGAQIGPLNTDGNAPAPDDVRTAVARDLEMVFQDEYIVGFQQAINQAWSYGVNATYRKVSNAVEDTRINHSNCPGNWNFPIINPGETNTLWCESTQSWVDIDTSVDGYQASGSGMVTGYKKPRRTYKAVEFQLDRAWDDKWAFNASYVWSKSEGNIEGPVNSDTGYADTNLVQFYDHPAVNERYGVLFNDFRHQIKLRGSYKLSEMWSFGATFSARSGGPITAFGTRWPNDNRGFGPGEFSGGGSGWLCVAECSSLDRQMVYTERGAFGRMPWVKDLGLNVTFTPFQDINLKARLSVYNVLNDQTVVNVHSRYESTPGSKMPYFGEGTVWQSPRYMQLVVSYSY